MVRHGHRCPSDYDEAFSDADANPHYAGYSATNYVAVHAGGTSAVSDSQDDTGNGLFGENSFSHMPTCVDGLSNTLAIGERYLSQQGNHGAIWMRSTNRAGDGESILRMVLIEKLWLLRQ